MTKMFRNFNEGYRLIIDDLFKIGDECIVRGQKVKEILNYSFTILNPRDRLLDIPGRNGKMRKYTFGELLWYLSGQDDVNMISKYSKFWQKITDDNKHCNSAYGKYIFGSMLRKGDGVNYEFEHPGRYTQWEWCKELLKKDPNTREAIIHIKPVQMYETKDVVCTLALHFYIRNNKLHLTTYMRSNDAVRGLTYDVFMFTFLQELMATELGVELGWYHHVVTNMHIYERDWKLMEDVKNKRYNNDTYFCLEPIPNDFRTNDLPILLNYEKFGTIDACNFNKLSALSWQLISFLESTSDVE